MRFRILALVLMIVMLGSVGCSSKKDQKKIESEKDLPVNQNYSVVDTDPDVITADSFIKSLKDWTIRLEAIAQKTSDAHSRWLSGKLNTEDYLVTLQNLQSEIKALKILKWNQVVFRSEDYLVTLQNLQSEIKALSLETDYKKYILSEEEKESLAFKQITKEYSKASKDINDFLHSIHLPDDQIKEKYNALVEDAYKKDISELKNNLKI